MRYLSVIILTVLASLQPSFAQPRENGSPELAKKHFLLNFGSLLCARNHSYLDKLEVCNMSNQFAVEDVKSRLDEWWGIVDRNTFINTVTWLATEGHRVDFEDEAKHARRMTPMDFTQLMQEYSDDQEIMYRIFLAYYYNKMFVNDMLLSWDLTRAVYLVRNAYTAGFITEDEAWRILEGLNIGTRMKAQYKSWEDAAEHYIMGRNYWSLKQTKTSGDDFELLSVIFSEMRDSPWNVYPKFESGGKPMPDYYQDDIKLPEENVVVPENNTNDPADYPGAIVVSSAEEFMNAYNKAGTGDNVFVQGSSTIFVKSGTYKLKLPLVITKSMTIVGQDRDNVIFQMNSNFNWLFNITAPDVTIDSVTMTCGKNPKAGRIIISAIQVKSTGCVVRNCKIERTDRIAVEIIQEGQAVIEKCLFRGNDEGIVCENGKLVVKESFIGGSLKKGIRLCAKSDSLVDNNIIRNNGKYGIDCYSNAACLLSNNVVSGNKATGIIVRNTAAKVEISNNRSFNNKDFGIWAVDAENIIIRENLCYLNEKEGICIQDANNIEAAGNKCYENAQSGIYSRGLSNKLSKNICCRNKNYGIQFNKQAVLAGNICNENLYPGILVGKDADALLESNTTERNMYSGVEIEGSAKVVMKKNICDNNYWAGLSIIGEQTSVSLEGNTFSDNGAWGIVCLNGAKKPQIDGNVLEDNYRGNEIEVKTRKETYLSRFNKLYGK